MNGYSNEKENSHNPRDCIALVSCVILTTPKKKKKNDREFKKPKTNGS